MGVLEDLQQLDSALASGVKQVKYQDKWVEYQSVSDMLMYRKILLARLSPGGVTKISVTNPAYNGGFDDYT